jgi:hypothetical protein
VLVSVGTGAGQINVSSGKVPATLSSADVTGNVAADVQTIKTQTVTCSAGVTVSPFVGSTGAAINGTNANTLSSHDPGETIMGATDLGTGSGLTSLATAAALTTAQTDLTTLTGRLTSTRAGYLDNLGPHPDRYFVTKAGNDSNPGTTISQAKLTIQAAVTAASAGDTVYVSGGAFSELVTLKDGVNLYFEPGSGIEKTTSIGATSSYLLSDGGAAVRCKIMGHGRFVHTDGGSGDTGSPAVLLTSHADSEIVFEFEHAESVYVDPELFGGQCLVCSGGKQTNIGRYIKGGTYVIDCSGGVQVNRIDNAQSAWTSAYHCTGGEQYSHGQLASATANDAVSCEGGFQANAFDQLNAALDTITCNSGTQVNRVGLLQSSSGSCVYFGGGDCTVVADRIDAGSVVVFVTGSTAGSLAVECDRAQAGNSGSAVDYHATAANKAVDLKRGTFIADSGATYGATAETAQTLYITGPVYLDKAPQANVTISRLLPQEKINGVTLVDTLTTYTGNTPQTGDAYARLGAPAGASIAEDISNIAAGSGLDAAGVRAAIGMASANLDTQLGAIDDFIDTEIGSALAQLADIKAQTDQMQFNVSGEILASASVTLTPSNIQDIVDGIQAGAFPAGFETLEISGGAVKSFMGQTELDTLYSLDLPTSPGNGTYGQAMLASWAQGYGKWVLDGTTLNMYGPANTVVRTFTLDSATAPTTRTPV